jgi:hypothetical protein
METRRSTSRSWRSDATWYGTLVVATGLAFGLGGGVLAGGLAAAGMLAFTVALAFGRRNVDAVRVVGGAGDERNQALYTRSLAAAGGLLGLVVTGWFLVGVAQGETDAVLLALTVLFAVSFVGSSVYHAAKG